MDDAQFEREYLPKYREAIRAIARKLAKRDDELFHELQQVGLIALWRLDPANATTNEDAWVRQALWNQMVSVLRRERRKKHESLDAYLERGAQVVADDWGEARVLSTAVQRPPRPVTDVDGPDTEE